jgi:biotin carboxylase
VSAAPPRILLLLPAASYRNEAFVAAARRLGAEVIACADYCHRLAPDWGLPPRMAVHFDQPAAAAEAILADLDGRPDAVIAVDDAGLDLAAVLAARLGVPANAPAAVRRLHDKLRFRELLEAAGLPCPAYHALAADGDPDAAAAEMSYPVVVKARRLSGSRGVLRADDRADLRRAVERVRRIQDRSDRASRSLGLVVEEFVPGSEHALEGLVENARLRVLAVFDKPDPLDGPAFEETILVTPSRLGEAAQSALADAVQRALTAAGLTTGPVHAEARINAAGVWLLEVAPRSIGGLCGRILTPALGMPLEEMILRQTLGLPVAQAPPAGAAGAMMIPIPRRGILQRVHNIDAALKVPGVTGVRITAEPGQVLVPPPEGASYLGFMFSQAPTPAEAEIALRLAHLQLAVDLAPEYPARRAG